MADDIPVFAAEAIVHGPGMGSHGERTAWRVRGQLTVWVDCLTFKSSKDSRRLALWLWKPPLGDVPPAEIVHAERSITLYRPRVGIPWLMLGVALMADGRRWVAILPVWEHARLRRALDSTDFRIEEMRTWAFVGMYDSEPPA